MDSKEKKVFQVRLNKEETERVESAMVALREFSRAKFTRKALLEKAERVLKEKQK